jgi:hypothetical protein
MSLVLPNVGEVQLLTMALKKATVEPQILKLFINDYTPVKGTVIGNLTEMSTLGYAAKALVRANWVISTVGGITTATHDLQTWTFTAGTLVTVYGYYIIETTSGVLLWAERFPGSGQPIQNTGDQVQCTPKFTQG